MADGNGILSGLLTRVASSQGLRLVAGSNVTPEVTLYDSAAQGSLLDTLGIVAYARVEDKDGNVIASYGETQPINPLLALAYWGLLVASVVAIARAIRK